MRGAACATRHEDRARGFRRAVFLWRIKVARCVADWARRALALLAGGSVAILPALAHAQQSTASKPPSESVHRLEREVLTLEMAPLSREQVTAFFVGRGMSPEAAALAAKRGCIFRSAIGNRAGEAGGPQLRIALAEWQVAADGQSPSRLGLREDWDRFWAERKLDEGPAVAFHWALFPTSQVFAPTDHNWGFLSFMLAPGKPFALEVAWHVGETAHRARIEGLRCAP